MAWNTQLRKTIKNIKNIYRTIDSGVGGILPGGSKTSPDVVYNTRTGTAYKPGTSADPSSKSYSPASYSGGSSGGSGSSSSNKAALNQARASQQAAQELARQQEITRKRLEQERIAQRERARIEAHKQKLLRANAQKNVIQSRDAKTGNKLVIETIKKGPNTIRTVRDLITGEIRYNVYGTGKGGGGVRLKEGISIGGLSKADNIKVKTELGKAGLIPITNKYGQVTGFRSTVTRKSYSYTDAGIAAFEKDMKSSGAKFRQIVKDDLDTGMSIKGPGFYLKAYNKYIVNPAIKIDAAKDQVFGSLKNMLKATGVTIRKPDEVFIKKAIDVQFQYIPGLKNKVSNNIILSNELAKITDNTLKKIPGWQINSATRLANISIKNKQAIIEITNTIRENPKLSNQQMADKIRRESTRQTIMDATEGASLLLNVIISSAVNAVYQLGIATPTLVKSLWRSPFTTIATLPPALGAAVLNDSIVVGKLFSPVHKGSPVKVVELIAEYAAFGAIFKGVRTVSKATTQSLMRFSPKYVKEVNGRWLLRKTPEEIFKVRGQTRYLRERVQRPSIKRPFTSAVDFLKGRKPGQFKQWTKDAGLELKTQTVSTGAMDFAKQFKQFSGREVTAINAAADQLTSFLRRKKMIRKPIGKGKNFDGEAFAGDYFAFPDKIGAIMKKFDKGIKLTPKEFIEVNRWLQANVAKHITLLERSLYADPAGGFRISRLSANKEVSARLRDILKWDFKISFKSQKPQVLIFEKAKVSKAPKNIQKIVNKFEKTKKISDYDLYQLVEWQTKSGTGLFKAGGSPIWEGGRELEVTLAHGELIKRIKQVGFTYINGKKITFVTAEVLKPTKAILKKIKLAESGKLTKAELSSLESTLSKKLGRKVQIDAKDTSKKVNKKLIREQRRLNPNIPVIRVRGTSLFVLGMRGTGVTKRVASKRNVVRKTSRRNALRNASKRTTAKRTVAKRTTAKRTVAKRTTAKRTVAKRTSDKRLASTLKNKEEKKKKPRIKLPKKFTQKTLTKKVPTFYVVEKVRGKFKKLYPKPLTAKDAKDYAVYSIDNRLSRTAFFIPLGSAKKVVSPPKNIQGYYSKNRIKVRPYKIRFGKKKQMVNGFIEKKKYFQDTKGEKAQLISTRRKAAKRKFTPTQRKKMLQNLKKARTTRLKKIKRK